MGRTVENEILAMSATYFKQRRQSQLKMCSNMRAAKERNRIENATAMRECGIILFGGEAFGGKHRIRLLTDDASPVLWLEVDGHLHRPRSYRGVLRTIARRLSRQRSG